jgi:hypothetical protein
VAFVAYVQTTIPPPPPGAAVPVVSFGGAPLVTRAATGTLVLGFLPVVPMTIISAALLGLVSALTPGARPGTATLAKYFGSRSADVPS